MTLLIYIHYFISVFHALHISGRQKISTKGRTKSEASHESSLSAVSTSTQLSTHDIQFIIEQLQQQQHRESTKNNYLAVWKIFNAHIA